MSPSQERPTELVAAIELAVEAVTGDLLRTSELNVSFRVTREEGRVLVCVDDGCGFVDGWQQPAFATDHELAKAEVADYVQEQIMDSNVTRFWPTCSEHDRGLHPELRNGRAEWFCRGGQHAVAPIGRLGL